MKHGYRSNVWNTCNKEYTLLRLLLIPKRDISDIFNHLITSIMEYFALCASLFLKNALISKRKSVTFCNGIGLSIILFDHFKNVLFLQYTEKLMLFYALMETIYNLNERAVLAECLSVKKNPASHNRVRGRTDKEVYADPVVVTVSLFLFLYINQPSLVRLYGYFSVCPPLVGRLEVFHIRSDQLHLAGLQSQLLPVEGQSHVLHFV